MTALPGLGKGKKVVLRLDLEEEDEAKKPGAATEDFDALYMQQM